MLAQWLGGRITDRVAMLSGEQLDAHFGDRSGAGRIFRRMPHRVGRDVTLLVRPRRAERLARKGLQIISPHGDFSVPAATVLAGGIRDALRPHSGCREVLFTQRGHGSIRAGG